MSRQMHRPHGRDFLKKQETARTHRLWPIRWWRTKQKALEKAQKAKVKGNTPQEKIASTKANRAAVEQAQKELDFWKEVAGEQTRIADEERKRREEYDAMMEEEESE